MQPDEAPRRHESIDHADPTDAGLKDPEGDDAPRTGIMGDETVVRDLANGWARGTLPRRSGAQGRRDLFLQPAETTQAFGIVVQERVGNMN